MFACGAPGGTCGLMGRLRTEATATCPAGQRREGVRMELGTVILGIIVVGAIVAAISFILVYILQLIQVASTPFHREGHTQDDVSLFLIDEVTEHLERK